MFKVGLIFFRRERGQETGVESLFAGRTWMASEGLASPCCALWALHGTWYQWNYFLSLRVKLEIWKKTRAQEGWGDEWQLTGEDSLESPGSSESCLTACSRSGRSLPQIKTERLRCRHVKHRSFPPVTGSSDKAQLSRVNREGKSCSRQKLVPCQNPRRASCFSLVHCYL